MGAHKDCQEKDYNQLFDDIINDIVENLVSLRTALKGRMSASKFFELIEDEKREKQYARATDIRYDMMGEMTLDIANDSSNDTIDTDSGKRSNNVSVQRDKLRIDAIHWNMEKGRPKKYGNKLDVTTDNKAINQPVSVSIDGQLIQSSTIKVKAPDVNE